MSVLALVAACYLCAASDSLAARQAPERVAPNDNRSPAGTLANGVLTLRLEVREGDWRPDRDADPGIVVRAFAEEGKGLVAPGPLVRVPEGTTIDVTVRNTLADSTVIVYGLSPRGRATATGADTVQVRPGERRQVKFQAGAPGTYYYWATTRAGDLIGRPTKDTQLNGAFVVDPSGTTGPARDRVLVIGLWTPTPRPGGVTANGDIVRFTINGKTWPNTERFSYEQGDSVRFRVINASAGVHPMHLHGFYFDVESRGDGTRDSTYAATGSRHLVVTERMSSGRTMALSWLPERAGNWLFHCHDNWHVMRSRPIDGSPLTSEHELHVTNHALEMMGGLVVGIEVRPKGVAQAARGDAPRRKLRLVARVDSGGSEAEPAYGYVLEDGTTRTSARSPLLPGPTIVLRKGEPVSIMVVNELPEATAVHWHGIELESYYDGVAGFAGGGGRIAPAIAPRDSFEARFTPPRSGTFMYHPHADEVRQQQAGLSGALLVVDDPARVDAAHDVVLLLSVPRSTAVATNAAYLNGTTTPAPLEMRVGERYRLRVINLHTYRPSMIARLTRDSVALAWRPVAKDGMDLPPDQATSRPAVLQLGNGEAYDFELVPDAPGDLRFTVTSGVGARLVTMPIRVR
jgi:FtsP/CotA-like multicopper oxidase with cupredoxin domain